MFLCHHFSFNLSHLSLPLSLSLSYTHTVLEATLFSSDSSAPHNVTIRVGHPAIINCASNYTSVPAPQFDWEIYRPFTRPMRASDNIVIGLNGSLYIRNPTSSHNLLGFRCTITNSPMVRQGYIQLLIDCKSLVIIIK